MPRKKVSGKDKSIESGVQVVGPVRLMSDQQFMKGDPFAGILGDVTRPMSNHAWVYACVRAISQNIGGVPIRIEGGTGKSIKVYQPNGDTAGDKLASVFATPNRLTTGYQLWENTTALLNLDGMAFWVLDRNRIDEIPEEITVHRKENFNALINDSKEVVGWVYRANGSGEPIPLTWDQVLVFKFFNPYDQVWGLSPIEAARRGIRLDVLAAVYGQAFFENNADPGGVITTDRRLSAKQAREIIQLWEERHRGPGNAKKVGVLYGGMKWQATTMSQRDMEFIEQRKWNRDEVLAVFKVPKSEISLFEDVNYATSMSQDKGFWQKTLIPIIKNFEAVLAAHFIPGLRGSVDTNLRIVFDLAVVPALQPDLDAKVTNAEKLYRIGYPINMINERLNLGMGHVEWGDNWYVNSALVPVEMLGKVPNAKPFGVTTPQPDGNLPEPADNEPPEEEPPSPEDNQDEKKILRKQAIRTLIQRSRHKNEIFESPFFVNNVSNHVENLSKVLRIYLFRLRSHQLARFVREEGIFNKKDWDRRFGDRLSESIKQVVKFLEFYFPQEGSFTVNNGCLCQFNELIATRLNQSLSVSELMDGTRKLFASLCSKKMLVTMSNLILIDIMRQMEVRSNVRNDSKTA